MMSPLDRVRSWADKAEKRFGPFTSAHEGFGVLAEEVAELLEAIRSNVRDDVEVEAIQVASVALRLAECCALKDFQERNGF